jgi:hypothetical protein
MVVINELGRNGSGYSMVIDLLDHLAGGNEENYKNLYPGSHQGHLDCEATTLIVDHRCPDILRC